MTFKIGDRVMIVYHPRVDGLPWAASDVKLIGAIGTVMSTTYAAHLLYPALLYQQVQLDGGESVGVAETSLRKIGDGPREDLAIVAWSECLWRPKRAAA
jgi:hypothetical protein